MKQFDLKEYLANPSKRVVTRDGRNARIICTDMRCENYPIVALVELSDNATEDVFTYTKDGIFDIRSSSRHDLFFAPEKHEGWVNLYKYANKDCAYYLGSINNSKAEAENKRDTSDKCIATIRIEWEE